MRDKNGWQPARLRSIQHQKNAPDGYDVPQELLNELEKKVVRVRPIQASAYTINFYRSIGCNATQFFELHPDDRIPGAGNAICEHELLTD